MQQMKHPSGDACKGVPRLMAGKPASADTASPLFAMHVATSALEASFELLCAAGGTSKHWLEAPPAAEVSASIAAF